MRRALKAGTAHGASWASCAANFASAAKSAAATASTEGAAQVDWMLPAPYLQTWAQCQARIDLNMWLAWARAARPA